MIPEDGLEEWKREFHMAHTVSSVKEKVRDFGFPVEIKMSKKVGGKTYIVKNQEEMEEVLDRSHGEHGFLSVGIRKYREPALT